MIQNLWDGILETYSIPPWEVKVSEKHDSKSDIITFKFNRIGTSASGQNEGGILGKIRYLPKQQVLELINYHVSLGCDILMLGKTSKHRGKGSEYAIGGHGEGLKIGEYSLPPLRCTNCKLTYGSTGINALVRNNHAVKYYTNSELWQFLYETVEPFNHKSLVVSFQAAPSHKRNGERFFVHAADQHTTVVVDNLTLGDISFQNYLFLKPCPSILASPDRAILYKSGYICLTPEHRGLLYVRGILVHHHHSEDRLIYGYNFLANVQLNRDRNLSSDGHMSGDIFKIWESVLLHDETSEKAAHNYLMLFLEHEDCQDICQAENYFLCSRNKLPLSRLLFKTFCSKHKSPDCKIWVHNGDSGSERIIQQLGRVPIRAPKSLFSIWLDARVAWSPQQQLERLFTRLSPSPQPSTPFAQHTMHLLAVMRATDAHLSMFDFEWKDGGDIDMDVLTLYLRVYIHDRNLDPVHTHKGDDHSCSIYARHSVDSSVSDINAMICDCAVFHLCWKISHFTLPQFQARSRGDPGRAYRNISLLYPRNPQVSSDPSPTIRWSINTEHSTFDIKLIEGKCSPGYLVLMPEVTRDTRQSPGRSLGNQGDASMSAQDAADVAPNSSPGLC